MISWARAEEGLNLVCKFEADRVTMTSPWHDAEGHIKMALYWKVQSILIEEVDIYLAVAFNNRALLHYKLAISDL